MLCLLQYFSIILFLACNDLPGHRGESENITESKKRGVFICEYKTLTNPYQINDTLQIYIKEAWLEEQWAYPQNTNNTIKTGGFQLCINSNKESLKGIDIDWTIGVNSELYFRESSASSLISDLVVISKNDTIVYLVQAGDNLSDTGEKKIIGKFVLIKK